MTRRYFEYLYNEICVAVNRRVSRHDLWLQVWESGGDPDDLTYCQVQTFLENISPLPSLKRGCPLGTRSKPTREEPPAIRSPSPTPRKSG
ncbi:MAG: hypothetical protein CL933_00090 [Deltaproteobacteria bacterium]|nr:hypothetical protein [Deltaproteobacteria bacterium]